MIIKYLSLNKLMIIVHCPLNISQIIIVVLIIIKSKIFKMIQIVLLLILNKRKIHLLFFGLKMLN